ncbi:glycosyltransferase family 2 protein [Dokdonia sp. Hel_I_53]|uniref:glycosyltransferase family 2 protein n=1 Tax=Dokdonia sp. Hel_I_53 TaxID=1566287 RepID=UPI00119A146D|nr:glycosyltransferase family 2 protein [Dokdonia sp. Hel_I_53]TVZ53436.1 glycosyltransferase involved in cell wall biosynthesis [Dokdonia sp. Hel_I_53]
MPKFSVIISVYNKASHIKETLDSVLRQTFTDYEIIVVNDASTDRSDEIINSISKKKIKYILLDKNVGAGAARNIGINIAKGDYISLLDGDDLWKPDYLKEMMALIKAFKNHRVFTAQLIRETKNSSSLCNYSFSTAGNTKMLDLDFFKSSFKQCVLHSSSTTLHREVFNNIGNYDPTIKSGQDTDLWIRIGLAYRIAFSTTPLVIYKFAPKSLYKSIKSTKDCLKLNKFKEEEKENKALKKYLDLNRYSLTLRARLWGEKQQAKDYLKNLDKKNLTRRQRWLVGLPISMLKMALKTQGGLEKLGIRLSSF